MLLLRTFLLFSLIATLFATVNCTVSETATKTFNTEFIDNEFLKLSLKEKIIFLQHKTRVDSEAAIVFLSIHREYEGSLSDDLILRVDSNKHNDDVCLEAITKFLTLFSS